MNDIFPSVVQAVAGEGFCVYAYMNDGSIRLVDLTENVAKGGIFERLKDREFFESVTVMNDTVAWDLSGNFDPANCIDIDPFTIAECEAVSDPLGDII